MRLDKLMDEVTSNNVIIKEFPFTSEAKGLYKNNRIAINSNLQTRAEKHCVLAEEYEHHLHSYGNILDITKISNSKQEQQAQRLAYERLVNLEYLAFLIYDKKLNEYEIADELQVTNKFLHEAILHYKNKYGTHTIAGDYIITFCPYFHITKKI